MAILVALLMPFLVHVKKYVSVAEIPMSLNKYDLNSYRRAKRSRALKIDLLIIVLFALAAVFIVMDHQPPRAGSPAFHKSDSGVQSPVKPDNEVVARAPN